MDATPLLLRSAELSRIFGFPELPNLSPRYNIAPTQDIAAVRLLPEEERRELVLMRWGWCLTGPTIRPSAAG